MLAGSQRSGCRRIGQGQSQALAQAGSPAAAPAAKPLPAYAGFKNADAVIVHSSTTIETKRSAFGSSVVTPTNQL